MDGQLFSLPSMKEMQQQQNCYSRQGLTHISEIIMDSQPWISQPVFLHCYEFIGVGDSHRAVRRLLRSYMRKPSKLGALAAESSQDPPQPDQSSQKPPQIAQSSQEPPRSAQPSQEPQQSADSSQEPPKSTQSSQEPPQSVDSSQEPPQSVDSSQEPPQSVDSSQEPPQSTDSHESAVTRLSQSLLKLVKSARQAAKQAFDRLESRVLRPDKGED
ncbi:hypothetical protein GBAR_LOCUS16381 [Geodia barretti]|uniref:Uncharacterized protein n=1 Tax=Geodia barretti TaxID=519541 RepID=A0AA35WW68_GEOBA|nr:hypothetical protein GBAR_LOCUS16381 [Geodia barretti]